MIPMDLDFTEKQEGTRATDKATSSTSTATTTSSWSRLKDPRIVRVSRAFGGKDRHSKVCTVKGLRDRRVRLSVPTAIQLYDLQERLGLNQPSKVVDWLLNAAKSEIDDLPPLQIPPEMMMITSTTTPSQNDHHFSASPNDDPSDGNDAAANNWSRNDEEENEITRQYYYNNFLSRSSVLQNSSSFSSMVMNTSNAAPYNNSSFLRWEYPFNLTLSQPPISLGLASAQVVHDDQDLQNFGRFVQFQPYNSADLVPSQNNNLVSEQNRHHEAPFS